MSALSQEGRDPPDDDTVSWSMLAVTLCSSSMPSMADYPETFACSNQPGSRPERDRRRRTRARRDGALGDGVECVMLTDDEMGYTTELYLLRPCVLLTPGGSSHEYIVHNPDKRLKAP